MSAMHITLRDLWLRQYSHRSYATVARWARQGRIRGVEKDPGGNYVVDMGAFLNIKSEEKPAPPELDLDPSIIQRLNMQ